jgi:hypothetical protein
MKAYLRADCPFSFKFLLFVTEARLLDRFEIVRCDPNSAQFEQVKAKLAEATGKNATFPTVEIEPGVYKSDSDALIAHFAKKHDVDVAKLAALSFYKAGILPQLEEMHG